LPFLFHNDTFFGGAITLAYIMASKMFVVTICSIKTVLVFYYLGSNQQVSSSQLTCD